MARAGTANFDQGHSRAARTQNLRELHELLTEMQYSFQPTEESLPQNCHRTIRYASIRKCHTDAIKDIHRPIPSNICVLYNKSA
jgi:hypothetical protein